jgi:hypothetical protein
MADYAELHTVTGLARRAGRAGSGRAGDSLEGIQDEIEADLEFPAVLVAGLQGVRGDQLREVGVITV